MCSSTFASKTKRTWRTRRNDTRVWARRRSGQTAKRSVSALLCPRAGPKGTDALRDQFPSRRAFFTARPRNQIGQVIAVPPDCLRSTVRHLEYDQSGYDILLECFESSIQIHRTCFDNSAACSNAATRTSTSSISIACFAWSSTLSAARTRTDGGVLVSTMSLRSVETAALVACCSRAVDCENAARRALRYRTPGPASTAEASSALSRPISPLRRRCAG
jgi:hypothetical protein